MLALRIFCVLGIGALIYAVFRDRFNEAFPRLLIMMWAAGAIRYFARDLVDIVPAIRRAARRHVHEKWNGRYYTYEGRHVRLCLADGTVWIVEADVRDIIVPAVTGREQRLMGTGFGLIPGTRLNGYSESGLLRLVSVRLLNRGGDAPMKKFFVWLEREAIPNVKRFPTSSAI